MKTRNLITSIIALNLALVNLPLKAKSLSESQMEEIRQETSAPRASIKFDELKESTIINTQVALEEEDKKAAATSTPHSQDQDNSSGGWFKSGLKVAGGFIGVATLTDYLTNKGLDMVEGAVLAATNSPWLAKTAKIGAYNTVYDVARDSSFIIGLRFPVMLEKAVHAVRNPKAILPALEEITKTGAKLVTTQIASYLLTQPTTELVGNTVYYATLFATGSPLLAQGLYIGAKGAMHYTGAGNNLAKLIGYNAPEVVGNAVSTVSSAISSIKSWWSGTAAQAQVATAPSV